MPTGTVAAVSPQRPVRVLPAGSWLTARPRPYLLGTGAVGVAFLVGALGAIKLTYGLALVGAIAVTVVVLVRPLLGGLTLAALVPVISGMAPGVPLPGVRVSEALIGLIGVALMVTARRRDAVPWTSVEWLLLAYGIGWLAFGAFDAQASGQHLSISQWGTLLGQLQFFLIYRGVRLSIRTTGERKLAVRLLLVAAAAAAILAVLQELRVPGVLRFLSSVTPQVGSNGGSAATLLNGSNPLTNTVAIPAATAASSVHRATGPFDSWTALAGYLFPVVLILCALALSGFARHRQRAFLTVSLVIVAGLFVTVELSAIAGVVGGVIALGALFGRTRQAAKWLFVGVALSTIVVGPLIAEKLTQEQTRSPGSSHSVLPQTLAYREQIWKGQYLPAIAQRPLTGYGVVLPSSVRWPYSESEYVTLLMEGGTPVLLLFGALAWALVSRGRKAARSPDPFDQALGRALIVTVAVLVVMDVVWPYMSDGGLPQVLYALVALASPPQLFAGGREPAG